MFVLGSYFLFNAFFVLDLITFFEEWTRQNKKHKTTRAQQKNKS